MAGCSAESLVNTLLDTRMLSLDAASLQSPSCPCDTQHDELWVSYKDETGCADAVRRKAVMQCQAEGGQAGGEMNSEKPLH